MAAGDHPSREAALVTAYEIVARRHNELGLTGHVDPGTRPFHGRPYRVLMAGRFAQACLGRIDDPLLRRLPPVGSIDQVADSTELFCDAARCRRLSALYRT